MRNPIRIPLVSLLRLVPYGTFIRIRFSYADKPIFFGCFEDAGVFDCLTTFFNHSVQWIIPFFDDEYGLFLHIVLA